MVRITNIEYKNDLRIDLDANFIKHLVDNCVLFRWRVLEKVVEHVHHYVKECECIINQQTFAIISEYKRALASSVISIFMFSCWNCLAVCITCCAGIRAFTALIAYTECSIGVIFPNRISTQRLFDQPAHFEDDPFLMMICKLSKSKFHL